MLIYVLMDSHRHVLCNVLCVLTDTHGHPVCADGHPRIHEQPRTSCVCWRTPTDVMCALNRQPTWAKITQTVHGKGQHAESQDQRADMSTDVLCVLTDRHGHTRTATDTATDILCVLTDTHGRTRTATDVL
ncbi:unnamed protein product [Brassica rapa]|uniref:Uncharacterized protein n=1 Tax=Brassica campestris TaxID=3711 RepID=A0A8D9DLF5_BRACM|nr:unnamed protein product [Brassica rapa]